MGVLPTEVVGLVPTETVSEVEVAPKRKLLLARYFTITKVIRSGQDVGSNGFLN